MNVKMFRTGGPWWALCSLLLVASLVGCSEENPLSSLAGDDPADTEELGNAGETITSPPSPAELATVSFGGEDVTFWPYTGMDFSGNGSDPINLVFAGEADPLRIRSALMALDGDRTAFGFPNVYPFNATWSDAHGDVQITYAGDNGWTGSVIQLQLGAYDPIRWHLRLFQTGDAFGSGVWTIAAVHFEVMIPGTADHQVLSWERAEEMVLVDMLRTGLLDPSLPYTQSEIINSAPSFREIPAMIYNGLPEDLKFYIGAPLGPVSDPVPIAADGRATILNVAVAQPVVGGSFTQDFVMNYEQVVPKPICNASGTEWVLVTGPVEFHKTVEVTPSGHFVCDAYYRGNLTVTPWDIGTMQPAGDPYPAEVTGEHSGRIQPHRTFAKSHDERIARESGGTELLMTWLSAANPGVAKYRVKSRCLQ